MSLLRRWIKVGRIDATAEATVRRKRGCLQGNVSIGFPEPTHYYLHMYIDLVSLGNYRSSRSQPPRLRYPSIHSAESDHILDQAYDSIFELLKYYLLYVYEISLD